MTDTLATDDEDDTDTFIVDTDDFKPATTTRRKGGVCSVCGKELSDGRSKYCAEHKPNKGIGKLRKSSPVKRGTKAVEDGMSETIAKILLLLTLGYAYNALRRRNIPDPNGDVSDAMALTDEESVALARPLARLFMSSERGRSIAPTIVDNRDLIDAAFAAWDWFQRTNEILDQYSATTSVQTPPVPTGEYENGTATQVEGNRNTDWGYVPGSAQDWIASV